MVRVLLLTMLSFLAFGCAEENLVAVNCQGVGVGYQCTVQHTQGESRTEACWRVLVTCANGTTSEAAACQAVSPGETASRMIPITEFPNAAACDIATGVQVVMDRATVSP